MFGWYLPASHCVQLPTPEPENVPASHLAQVPAATPEYLPAWHVRHVEAPLLEYVPEAQSAQSVRPVEGAIVPAMQLPHASLPDEALKVPSAHSSHTDAFGV
jgi:hypothetical protein